MSPRPALMVPDPGRPLAVVAESLYLANLLIAPGVAFLMIAWLWLTRRTATTALGRNHLHQAFAVSLWGGALLVLVCVAVVATLGLTSAWTWTLVILYFTCIHSTLVVFGILGLSKALAGQPYVYPLIGPAIPPAR